MGMITIFSIDNCHDLHTMAKFLRHIDTQKALGYFKSRFDMCIGRWKDKLEYSFIMDEEDFNTYVKDSGYVDNQECFLTCDEADLVESTVDLGDWTYKIKEDRYLLCR